MTRPVVQQVSQATRLMGSARSISSRMRSEIWSQILSGCPSVTDSDVNNLFKLLTFYAGKLFWKKDFPAPFQKTLYVNFFTVVVDVQLSVFAHTLTKVFEGCGELSPKSSLHHDRKTQKASPHRVRTQLSVTHLSGISTLSDDRLPGVTEPVSQPLLISDIFIYEYSIPHRARFCNSFFAWSMHNVFFRYSRDLVNFNISHERERAVQHNEEIQQCECADDRRCHSNDNGCSARFSFFLSR